MTSDLAIEIKKLADKYRNNKKTGLLDSSDFGNELNVSEYKVSNSNDESTNIINEFDYRNLDNLEKEIDDFGDLDISVEDVAEEVEELAEEIQIADFINPSISIVSNVEDEVRDANIDDVDLSGEIEQGDKRKVNDSLKIISRNLRDLKALLRS